MNDKNYEVRQVDFQRHYLHRQMAEKVLGRPLLPHETVHHVDEDKKNNINTNFCICDKGFHVILHQNIVALKACGNKRYRKCSLCHTYDDPENMLNYNGNHRHRKCVARYNKAYKKKYYMLHPRDYKQEYQDKINRRLSV